MKKTTSSPTRRGLDFKTILIIFILLVAGGVCLWQAANFKASEKNLQNQISSIEGQLSQIQGENSALVEQTNESFELINNYCSSVECLFNVNNSKYPLGLAVIEGYYSPVERTAWEETKECDSFTVTGGSEELIRVMVELVDGGNTVHSKNELGQPIINLGLDLISDSEFEAIKNSDLDNPIELTVLLTTPPDIGVEVCYRDVIVLR
ncbi:MAG: hypothetical protein UX09_C0019G0006 [Candidatus Uhrbacteria bacterium GW2011_GWE2_45_35]|uniref:Uncharacterized protein n=2 Tax=Candidatus Uhriibacteriota TaxID=1752732 RepID=A0A0G1JJ34_9BACT|nr:MAG: hypothetical protein UW63_C0018G0005 [Candidatus Uhrbacteria bacterium GW2011_GWF2_44_350]KKU08307.1 MAG: hypothetical protein UX09_C0019G0006 [Candidatus Uhrbacteria bacterium GW2011_GWE2_45_35]HBR81031.1 hypothetical protein [Candidatus Uhrbacteria bacterium]HCU31813.1 hypothetical protein [Candidatus Uhrbacteria bacterium]